VEQQFEPESLVVTMDTGDRLHYLDWGGPTTDREPLPPLLLIHGLASTAWSWAPICRRLRAETRVLAVDLRGHGLSESPRTGYDLESLAYDALTVLSANGFGADLDGPPAAVAGHGLGAAVAVTMANLRPLSVAALALVEGGFEDVAEATGMSAADYQRSIGEPPEVMASLAAYLTDRREFDPPTWDADQERAARAAVDEKHAGHVASVMRAHALRGSVEALFSYRPRAALAQVAAPVLIAVAESGAADDETTRERRIALEDLVRARAAAGVSAPDVRVFPGTGHNLMRYRPDELSGAIRELLEGAAHQRS
jgi:pimeloyl-ACP methyl ester carboxylesterase